jgi:hypothetical protein
MKTFLAALHIALASVSLSLAAEAPAAWKKEWPRTDFSQLGVDPAEIDSNLPRDSIRSIDAPRFIKASDVQLEDGGDARAGNRYSRRIRQGDISLSLRDPVISFTEGGETRAYPLRIMMFHEIVNDVVGRRPVAVTYCPLCNAAVVFDRRIDGRAIAFGVTGKLRHSDLIMYDRETHSWWQQFTGVGIVGAYEGRRLERLPARLESFESFARRFPDGLVLMPDPASSAPYGKNPYFRYDTASQPFLYRGRLPEGVEPLARVIVVDGVAYALARLQRDTVIDDRGYRISWRPGQASALDARDIAKGRDVGDIIVQKRGGDGGYVDVPYDVTFAFAFYAFNPEGVLRN